MHAKTLETINLDACIGELHVKGCNISMHLHAVSDFVMHSCHCSITTTLQL